jgi:myb proto-oncogene protein
MKMVFENLGYSDAVKDCNRYEEMRNNVKQITEPQQMNTRKWSQAEERLFEEAIKAQGILPGKRIQHGAWDAVARHVKTRSKEQCKSKYKNGKRNDSETHNSGTWSKAEDALLRKAVAKHSSNWIEVAKSVGTRDNLSCHSRWMKIKDKTKRFGPNDDRLLIQAVKEHGRKWTEVAKVVPGYDANQCMKRFGYLEVKKRKNESSKSSQTYN